MVKTRKTMLIFFLFSCFLLAETILDDFSEIKWKFRNWDAKDGKVSLNSDIFKDGKYSMKFEYSFEKVGATCIEWRDINGNWSKEKGIGFMEIIQEIT